jgi:tetratricopeptide (TPR) repeat protein
MAGKNVFCMEFTEMPHPFPCAGFVRKLSSASLLALFLASGAFAAGLPGEYLVTQRWRALNNPYSSLSNPANIAEENYLSLRAAVAPVLQGAFTLSEIGVNYPISLYHTASFTMLIEGAGAVYEDAFDENTGKLVPDTKSPLSNSNFMFSLGYAWHAWQRLIVGANINFAYQTNFGNPLMGTGVDLGATYRVYKDPVLGEHIVGLATQNLVAPSMGTALFDFSSTAGYARDLRLTGYSKFWENRIENYIEIDLKDFLADDANWVGNPSAIEWDVNWRIGYWAMRMFKAYLLVGFDGEGLGYWGLALGAQMPSFNRGRDLAFYYQYNMMTEENSDATSHSLYMKADFGRHREEEYARRVARMASLNPNELYNRGRKLYSEGKYWEAFFVFSRLMVEFPDFFRNDWVSLFRSDCQEQLDMRERAIDNYTKVKEAYPSGEVVPYADLGLMRIYYRNNDFPQATSQFVELNKPGVPDSLRFHGTYIMGQIYLQNGELRKALQAFSIIPDSHPDYIFAQHAMAVTHAVLGSDIKDVIAALENVINTTPKTKQAQEMVNRSYLFMGFIFYEENALSKAVTALRQVPANSYYTEDALLGQAWTALKARQWNDCINVGKTLQNTTQHDVLRAEGLLLQSYGYMLQKEYPRSLELLRAANAICEKLSAPPEDSLNVRTLQYDNSRLAYSQLADRVEGFSQIGQTSHLTTVLDSLKNKSTDFIKGFHDFQRYKHEYQRGTFFSRTIDQVKEDVEYAMAKVQKIMGVGKSDKKAAEHSKELDAEIERLKKEMENIEE